MKPALSGRVVVIGIGGIGSWLVAMLSRYLAHRPEKDFWQLVLVDGDEYEPGNESRQLFPSLSVLPNKADCTAGSINHRVLVNSVAAFVGEESPARDGINVIHARDVLQSGDTVFVCVDNHKARKHIASVCEQLPDVLLISGGNELTDGNVQTYARSEESDLTPTLTCYHPEIAKPADKSPHEMSCDELAAAGTPQLIFTNVQAALLMAAAFYRHLDNKTPFPEVYFDITAMKSVPRSR